MTDIGAAEGADGSGGAPRAQRGVRSLETAGTVLRRLARAEAPMMLRDLSEALNMAASQLHPYLVSLRASGLVEQTERGLYTLGPFALELGLSRLRSQNAYRETIRRVPALVEELQLMVAVTVWGLHGATIVYVEESPNRIHANVQPGGIFRMTNTATGALFAAFHPPAQTEPVIRQEIDAATRADAPASDFDEGALRARIRAVRAQGYATTRDIPIPGVSAIAAPVFDHTGVMKLALTVIGPTGLIGLEPTSAAVARTLGFVRTLSSDLGWVGAASD
ncbi:IclR family transcriptional regulator [Pararhodobacter sp. SW119]|uniref:IclR family transcriptional regulator n=1 Tax=Pararhodobacter sp. SW119 TaxID=2780075 RepID=UPI001AE06220|nr:IclR family transcriptional regulator [Pararhodobacter sp. SW119]